LGDALSVTLPGARYQISLSGSVNGSDEDAEGGNSKVLQRQRSLFRLRGGNQRLRGRCFDAKRREIEFHLALFSTHVQHNQNGVAVAGILPQISENVGIIAIQRNATSVAHVPQCWIALAQCKQPLVERKDGVRVLGFDADIVFRGAGWYREPSVVS